MRPFVHFHEPLNPGTNFRPAVLVGTLADPERTEVWIRLLASRPTADGSEIRRLLDGLDEACRGGLLRDAVASLTKAMGADMILSVAQDLHLDGDPTFMAEVVHAIPERREAITARILARARSTTSEHADSLGALVPLAPWMTLEDARHLLQRFLDYFFDYHSRCDLLDDWTGVNLGALAPLVDRAVGKDAVIAIAREVTAVADWLP